MILYNCSVFHNKKYNALPGAYFFFLEFAEISIQPITIFLYIFLTSILYNL